MGGNVMKFLKLFHKKKRNKQIISDGNTSLENSINNIYEKRREQIQKGLNKETASTGYPMKKLHGGAKNMAQMSNIGGGSKATGGGGVEEGMKAVLQYTQTDTAKKMISPRKKSVSEKKKKYLKG